MSLSHTISQAFGRFASHQFNPTLQNFLNSSYSKAFCLDMSEFESPENYPSLQALFTRKLVNQRIFDENPNAFISPCDSLVIQMGTVVNGQALQIKDKPYAIAELLNSTEQATKLESGSFINFYLSPRDYHRFHAPLDISVLWAVYIPGALYPVNNPALKNVDSLYAKNERVSLCCEDARGQRFYLVFVGALNVGKIAVSFDERIQTNADVKTVSLYEYDNVKIKKGEELGYFAMGSSIVGLFPTGFFMPSVKENAKVRFGETIATLND